MLPRLTETSKSRDMIQEFLGINHNVRASDGEFYNMKNMTSDFYPTLAPRKPRGVALNLENCGGLLAKDKLLYIENDTLHYGDVQIPLDPAIKGDRSLVSMGAYVVVFPDNIYLNTSNVEDYDHFYVDSIMYPTDANSVSISLCDKNGDPIPVTYINGYEWVEGVSDEYELIAGTNVETLRETPINIFGSAMNLDDYRAAQKEIYGENYFLGTVSRYGDGREAMVPNHFCWGWGLATEINGETVSSYRIYVDGSNDKDHLFTISRTTDNDVILTVANAFSGVKRVHIAYYNSSQEEIEYRFYGYIETKHWTVPKEGEYLLDNTGESAVLKQCINGEWKEVQSYLKISTPGIGTNVTSTSNKIGFVADYKNILTPLLNPGTNYNIITAKSGGQNSIIISGILQTGVESVSDITVDLIKISRPFQFDYVIESQNRLWACRRGEDAFGNKVNEIYASALGSFREWQKFDGTDADSYTVSLGSDGEFTGAVNYNGYPIFFKENCIHKIYGNYPSSYQVTTENSFGMQKGSAKSAQVIAGKLFYKAIDGVYAYDGASTSIISSKLGLGRFSGAVGGNIDNKYYLSMISAEDGKRYLYVYDIMKDVWHIEDDLDITYMERFDDNLWMSTESGTVYTVKDKHGTSNELVEWFAETGVIGYTLPDSKYVSQIQLRINIAYDAEVSLYIEYDSDGDWTYKGSITGNTLRSYTLPIQPRRCDHFKLRLEGKGECKIFSLTKILENGGNV